MAEALPRQAAQPACVDRRPLVRLAYRLLGSVADAEDVVQDAHVKLLALARPPDEPQAWLFRVVTNLAIDRLRHLQVQRRAYPGPWLPEPLATPDDDGEHRAARLQDLSVGLLLLLERLSAGERVAFVLREAFDLDFREIGRVLDVSADACRQRYHRARRKLRGAALPETSAAQQRDLLEQLAAAVLAGDRGRLTRLLAEDAVLITDGGGRVAAAIRPVENGARIAQVLVHLAGRDAITGMTFEWRSLNGGVALLIRQGSEPSACIQVAGTTSAAPRVAHLYVVRNPDKLRRLA